MGVCDFHLIGQKGEIEKLGKICKKVYTLLKTKYKEGEEFRDWTGISEFLIFQKPDEYTGIEMVLDDDVIENAKAADWIGCEPWDENQAAIWWWEIDWPYKIPSEVWQMMMREGRKLGVLHLVTKIITFLDKLDEVCIGAIVKEFHRKGEKVRYPRDLF